MEPDVYLRTEASTEGVRDDWEVRTGPNGVEVSAWTSDRFVQPAQATRTAERLLHELLALQYRVVGPCEITAVRDRDGDWRGHLTVRLSAVPAPASQRGAGPRWG